jgi:serine/threonine-protein kinase
VTETPGDPAAAERIAALFAELSELDADERRRRLAALREAPDLAAEVESLLTAHRSAADFLEILAPQHQADLLADLEDQATENRRVGAFRILREIGRGGMGVVYEASRADGDFEQRVAIKILPWALADDLATARFRRERRLLACLDHKNIARLVDGGLTDEDLPYFAMELVEGERITDYCEQRSLPIEARLRLFVDVCGAVSHAHRNLIVHCDLKPSNVLVTPRGEVKLLDFGIARMLDAADDEALTRGRAALTPQYAAPDQLRGEPPSTATDIYGLGVLLWELLTGRRLFEGQIGSELVRAVETLAPPAPSSVCAAAQSHRLRGDPDTIALEALRKEPQRRYASVEALAGDVERHLAGRPITARPATIRYRLGKFLVRHRVATAAAGVALLVVLAGAGVALWQAAAHAREAQKSERMADFLIELFQEADPFKADEPVPSLEAFLDEAVHRLDERMGDDPLVRAEMLQVIGRVYLNLERPQKAEPLLTRSVAIRRRALGGRHPDLAVSLLDLGETLGELGEYERARASLEESLQINIRAHGPESVEVASVTAELSDLAFELGDFDTVERLDRQVLEIRRQRLGPAHPEVATALSNLGTLAGRQGRLAESEALHREALALRRAHFGERHAEVAASLNNLVVSLERQGRVREAFELNEEVLAIRREVFGEQSSVFANSLGNQGNMALTLGDWEGAEASLSRSSELFAATVGTENFRVFVRVFYRGLARIRLDKTEAGLQDLRAGIAGMAVALGDDHSRVAGSRAMLGRELAHLGRHDEAMAEIEASEVVLRQDPEGSRLASALAEEGRALSLAARGRPSAADAAFERAVGIMSAGGLERHPTTAEILVDWGRQLRATGDAGAAIEKFRRAAETRRTLLGEDTPLTCEAEIEIAESLLSLQGPAAAADALAAAKAILSSQDSALARALMQRARSLETLAQQPAWLGGATATSLR